MDKYYNPQTQETVTRNELKKLLNMSFPNKCEQVGAWWLLHTGASPEVEYGQSIAPDAISIIDGHYTQTYKAVGEPREREESVEDRLSDIEMALVELAGMLA